MSRLAITSKDVAPTARKISAIDHCARVKDAAAIKASLQGKKFADLLPPEKDDLLKAIAISLGFIDRG